MWVYSFFITAKFINILKAIAQILIITVFRARSLASVDMISKSDPYVVVELVNALLQTHTEYKTINPEWNKLFTL